MKIKKNWVIIYVVVFFAVITVIGLGAKEKIKQPLVANNTSIITPAVVVDVDERTDLLKLELAQPNAINNTLKFYTNHQEVYVYVNDELIYSLESVDSIYGNTPGAVWNTVTLPEGTTEVFVKVVQAYSGVAKQGVTFELGNAVSIYKSIFRESIIDILFSLVILMIGFLLCAYWIILFSRKNMQMEMVYLGLFSLVFGAWNLGETQFAVFIFQNRAFWSYFAFTCLMTMTIPAVYFFKEFLAVKYVFLHRIVIGYMLIQVFVCQLLHVTGIFSLKQTATYIISGIVLMLLYLIVGTVLAFRGNYRKERAIINLIGLTILLATAILDIGSYFTDILNTAKFTRIGFLIYVCILGVETIHVARERMQEEQKVEFIKEMAVKDLLTGCYNRNAYTEDVNGLTDLSGIQIIGFDLNNLKKCNDTRGHKAGDQYILDAAHMICDIFGEFGSVYRVGGDEFCILGKDINEEQIAKKCTVLLEASEKYRTEHNDDNFGIACGYAVYDANLDANLEDTRDRADSKMYENKKILKEHM